MRTEQALTFIAHYLSGNISPEQLELFEAWRKESPENDLIVQEAEKIWNHSTIKLRLDGSDTEGEWQRLQSRIHAEKEKGVISLFVRNHWMKIAASVALLFVIYWVIKPSSEPPATIVSGDQVATVYLPDSTKVWLNVHSKLTYSHTYGEEKRDVMLEGEGYFQVTPDPDIVFRVISDKAITKVEGTVFNIKDDSTATVTVTEGKVTFSSKVSPSKNSITVEPGEKALIGIRNSKPIKIKNDDPGFASWRTRNNPVYNNETQNPMSFLSTEYDWKKNQINQSVIDGSLQNKATLAAYKNIVLKVTYTKPNGTKVTTYATVFDTVQPGQTIRYRKSLLDIFTDTKALTVSVEKAEIAEQ